jgi:hypothetical protein
MNDIIADCFYKLAEKPEVHLAVASSDHKTGRSHIDRPISFDSFDRGEITLLNNSTGSRSKADRGY